MFFDGIVTELRYIGRQLTLIYHELYEIRKQRSLKRPKEMPFPNTSAIEKGKREQSQQDFWRKRDAKRKRTS